MNVDSVMRDVTRNVKAESADRFRMLTFKVARDIIKGTPVDEGTARASWNITKAAPNFAKNAPNKNRGLMPTDVPQNLSLAPYYIASSIPYMQRLEFGHSSQNQGFIRAALTRQGLL